MKKRLIQLSGILTICFFLLFSLDIISQGGGKELLLTKIFPKGYSQIFCDPPSPSCGPLKGNRAGTSFCCGNTNSDCCYAAGCGGSST